MTTTNLSERNLASTHSKVVSYTILNGQSPEPGQLQEREKTSFINMPHTPSNNWVQAQIQSLCVRQSVYSNKTASFYSGTSGGSRGLENLPACRAGPIHVPEPEREPRLAVPQHSASQIPLFLGCPRARISYLDKSELGHTHAHFQDANFKSLLQVHSFF